MTAARTTSAMTDDERSDGGGRAHCLFAHVTKSSRRRASHGFGGRSIRAELSPAAWWDGRVGPRMFSHVRGGDSIGVLSGNVDDFEFEAVGVPEEHGVVTAVVVVFGGRVDDVASEFASTACTRSTWPRSAAFSAR